MSHAAIRAAIVATLSAVPGIGRVHDYERYAANDKAFRDLYASGGQLLGWHVRRVAARPVQPAVGVWLEVDEWVIRGFMAISDADASEKTFDALLDAVMAAFRDDETLGGAVISLSSPGEERGGAQLVGAEPVMFAGVLCHSAQLSLLTRFVP